MPCYIAWYSCEWFSNVYGDMYIPECYFMCFALYGCTHWRLGVIMAPALSLLAAPEVVMMTPSGVGWWQDRRCGGPQSSVKSGCGVNLPTHVCYMLPCMCMYVCMFIDNKKKSLFRCPRCLQSDDFGVRLQSHLCLFDLSGKNRPMCTGDRQLVVVSQWIIRLVGLGDICIGYLLSLYQLICICNMYFISCHWYKSLLMYLLTYLWTLTLFMSIWSFLDAPHLKYHNLKYTYNITMTS